ncbi:MAG: hypothetical protein WHS89_12570 [Acidimicrobiales bacterium]
MTNTRCSTTLLAVAVLVTATLATACNSDDSTMTSTPNTTAPGRQCEAVGTDLASQATERVEVELADYVIVLQRPQIQAGTVTFVVTNIGTEDHELAFLPGGGSVPTLPDGSPDEDALEAAGAFELEAFGPGQTCEGTFQLAAGTYRLFCVVRSHDGRTHLAKGMETLLTVS